MMFVFVPCIHADEVSYRTNKQVEKLRNKHEHEVDALLRGWRKQYIKGDGKDWTPVLRSRKNILVII